MVSPSGVCSGDGDSQRSLFCDSLGRGEVPSSESTFGWGGLGVLCSTSNTGVRPETTRDVHQILGKTDQDEGGRTVSPTGDCPSRIGFEVESQSKTPRGRHCTTYNRHLGGDGSTLVRGHALLLCSGTCQWTM